MGTKIETIRAARGLKKLNFVKQQISSGRNFVFFFQLVGFLLLFIDLKMVLILTGVCVSRFTICHKSEVVKNTLNPVWQPFSIPVRALCNGDYERWDRCSSPLFC